MLRKLASRVPAGRLARNTVYSTSGLVLRACIQAAYLIVLSRRMGSYDYGLFAGSVAAAVLIAPLSGWGISWVMTQWIAREPRAARALWATALIQTGLSGGALAAFVLIVAMAGLGERLDAASMLMLALAELVALPVAQIATSLCVVLGNGAAAALTMCLVPACRLLAVVVAFAAGVAASPPHIAACHFAGSVTGAFAAIGLVTWLEGAPAWRERIPVGNATASGSRYAIGALVGISYPEIDKVMLLQLAGASIAGAYTVAFRVMAVLVLPISALVGNALPRLFAAPDRREVSRVLTAVTWAALAYAILATVIAFLAAPLMPSLFGSTFAETPTYLRLLSLWAPLFALHQCATLGLTGTHRQWTRIAIEASGILIIVAINLVAIPSFAGRGSVLALLSAEAFMAAAAWLALRTRTAVARD